MVDVTGGVRYFFMKETIKTIIRPYGAFSMGLYRSTWKDDISKNDFGFNVGGGAMYNISDKLYLDGAARYNWINYKDSDWEGSTNLTFLEVTVGLAYNF